MAEELVQSESGVTEASGGDAEASASQQTKATAVETKERQPESPKVNLNELPEFRQYQQSYDRRLNQVMQERQQMQAQLDAIQQQAREQAMSTMDDYEKERYMRTEAEQRAAQLAQRMELLEAERYRDTQLRTISQETEVPMDQLDQSSPDAAWRSAVAYLKGNQTSSAEQEAKALAQQQGAAPPAAPVDLGGGNPRTSEASYRAQLSKARKANDSYEYLRLKDEMRARGYNPD